MPDQTRRPGTMRELLETLKALVEEYDSDQRTYARASVTFTTAPNVTVHEAVDADGETRPIDPPVRVATDPRIPQGKAYIAPLGPAVVFGEDDDPITVGDVLHGHCGGAFAHYYGDKRVVGIGDGWVVVREENGVDEDNGALMLYAGDPDDLREYR